jgi:predicted nucleotidyltransferase component of viral defense system
MIGTKIRALYQRKKGRDLYDLYKVITLSELNIDEVIICYKEYMNFVVDHVPSKKQFLQNMELKMNDSEFIGDTKVLLRPDEMYNPHEAWEIVKKTLIERI